MLNRLYDPESLLLTMKDGLLLLNAQSQILFINEAARLLLNIAENNIDNAQKLPAEIIELANQIDSEIKESEGELELNINGQTEYFQVNVQLVKNSQTESNNAPSSADQKTVLVVLHEVTRLHKLENLRREFVANVSHELKTPITSIKAGVETLQDGAMHDLEIMPKFLDIIARQSDRLNNIIEDLLSLSRLENERDEVYLIEGAVLDVIVDATNTCEAKAKQKKMDIQVNVPKNLKVKMNSSLIEQAVMNLVDNAIKYGEAGTVVNVVARKVDHEIEISVSDQGKGIETEHLSRIFERFYRIDKARSRNAGGSGLGLAIVKHIAQVHGGRATVSSVPGQGSTFSLFIASI